jgi:hypothetical protein
MRAQSLNVLWITSLGVLWLCGAETTLGGVFKTRIVPVGEGWAKNSINATIFRVSSITSHGDTQYICYYSDDGHVVLGKRKVGSTQWQVRKTRHTGDTRDAHNGISMGVDGSGVVHVAWDHHCDPLRYCRGVEPGSLELADKTAMTGRDEEKVTYPEFYNLPDGDLLFLYRDGHSGGGNTMLNRYDVGTGKWSVVNHPLIDGQGGRNAYTNQIAVDKQGCWHISWCWRESGDVASNHDICYARSSDEGRTWQKSTGEVYRLPITAGNAECVWRIPQKSELINHTSMAVDSSGRPVVATYWRGAGTEVPQYQIVYHDGKGWRNATVGRRRRPFSLSGVGTKYLPISRPRVLVDCEDRIYVIFRDVERGNRVSAAVSKGDGREMWDITELSEDSVGEWEPSVDAVLWRRENVVHLFLQKVRQIDMDVLEETPPSMVSVLEWSPS